jgi:hypothetical protein
MFPQTFVYAEKAPQMVDCLQGKVKWVKPKKNNKIFQSTIDENSFDALQPLGSPKNNLF